MEECREDCKYHAMWLEFKRGMQELIDAMEARPPTSDPIVAVMRDERLTAYRGALIDMQRLEDFHSEQLQLPSELLPQAMALPSALLSEDKP